jgi:hypothetical protein
MAALVDHGGMEHHQARIGVKGCGFVRPGIPPLGSDRDYGQHSHGGDKNAAT